MCNPLSLSVGETHEYHQWYSYDQVKLYGKGEGNFANVIKRLNQLGSVQSLSQVQVFANPQTAARQASLSITNSWSLLRLMSIKSVIPSNHLILCHPLLLPRSIFPSIRVISNESALPMKWPKYWSFSFSIIPSKEIRLVGSPCSSRDSQESSPTPQFKIINSLVLSFLCSPILTSILD